ncbi:MAG: HAD family phosphatase [Bacteroidales bacterium]|nr:HAD family phosphatase [Bacteroidales bacterium]MBN2764596.1 HAD family phosphatase [Bacteroidales bacterium]
MLRAVLFDMDGVLVDTEELTFRAAQKMFEEHGVRVTQDDFRPYIGTGENSYIGNVARKYGFPVDLPRDKARMYGIFGELAKGCLKALPGVVDFIRICRENGLKLALATSADYVKMMINLKETGLDHRLFDVLVNGQEVNHKKPDPEIYLLTAARLGMGPDECLVVEDAVNGIEAAKVAGMKCLALTNSFTAQELNKADWICDSLDSYPKEALDW